MEQKKAEAAARRAERKAEREKKALEEAEAGKWTHLINLRGLIAKER